MKHQHLIAAWHLLIRPRWTSHNSAHSSPSHAMQHHAVTKIAIITYCSPHRMLLTTPPAHHPAALVPIGMPIGMQHVMF